MHSSKLYDTREIKSTRKGMKFETYGNCFVCGENNPNGLRLSFQIDKERQTLKTTFTASRTFQGWDGIVHGGMISTLLDEAMAKLVYELGYHAVTASLEIKFKKPAPILEPLHIYGAITEVNKRLIRAKAHVAKGDGTILATGISTFLKQTLR
jgi:acyl-coenzyme A thioesterase PaaI-like protein